MTGLLPECPLGNARCWLHRPMVDLSRVGVLDVDWRGDDEAHVKIDVEIEWCYERSETTNADIGFDSVTHANACHCLLVAAREQVLELVGQEHPCVDDMLRVYGMVNYALGAGAQCVVAVASPERPPWWPVRSVN